ncbi:MAG: class I SAM-dependent methyltransferase [Candidatus Fonsibacter ubiquis]
MLLILFISFSENEIMEIYNKYVKKEPSYYEKVDEKYSNLTQSQKDKFFNTDFPRVASLFDFEEWVKTYNLNSINSLLSTCRGDFELEYIKCNNITYCEYDGKNNDLHTLNLDKKNYDMIIFNQTLEHLYNPFICMKNLFDHLKPGGYLYTTVPTVNIPHMVPFHFWGMTPMGLCMLSKSVGFNILECGFWGNYQYINYIFSHGSWQNNSVVFDNNLKIKSTSLCQAQTWILIQKPQ